MEVRVLSPALRDRLAALRRGCDIEYEQGRNVLTNEGIPRISQAPGFVSGNWVRLTEDSGRSMIVFESEDAARGAAEMLRSNPPGGEFVTLDSIEVGEVVGSA